VKKIVLVSLAMVMSIAVPCLAFQGHEGQIPLCQNNKTGSFRFAPVKDIDLPSFTSNGVTYAAEPEQFKSVRSHFPL
jgi:hypothetical protein